MVMCKIRVVGDPVTVFYCTHQWLIDSVWSLCQSDQYSCLVDFYYLPPVSTISH